MPRECPLIKQRQTHPYEECHMNWCGLQLWSLSTIDPEWLTSSCYTCFSFSFNIFWVEFSLYHTSLFFLLKLSAPFILMPFSFSSLFPPLGWDMPKYCSFMVNGKGKNIPSITVPPFKEKELMVVCFLPSFFGTFCAFSFPLTSGRDSSFPHCS